MLIEWDGMVERNSSTHDMLHMDAIQLAETAQGIRRITAKERAAGTGGEGNLLAPWWLTPALAYWTGIHGVGGSSHEALAGNREAARFFTTDDLEEARQILRQRQVRFVVTTTEDTVRAEAARLSGTLGSGTCLAVQLYAHPAALPEWVKPRFANLLFRVYEVTP